MNNVLLINKVSMFHKWILFMVIINISGDLLCQKLDYNVVIKNKAYFSCYRNPFFILTKGLSDWDRNFERYPDTLDMNLKVNFHFTHKKLKIIIQTENGEKSKIVFLKSIGHDNAEYYIYKGDNEIDKYFSCSKYSGEYRVIERGNDIIFYYKEKDNIDIPILFFLKKNF
jgi:hypothetical protein